MIMDNPFCFILQKSIDLKGNRRRYYLENIGNTLLAEDGVFLFSLFLDNL